jgi:hypothetical protein
LRHRFHQRGIWIDLRGLGAVGAFFKFGSEFLAQAVAEVDLVNGTARELVRNLERLTGRKRAGACRCNEDGYGPDSMLRRQSRWVRPGAGPMAGSACPPGQWSARCMPLPNRQVIFVDGS